MRFKNFVFNYFSEIICIGLAVLFFHYNPFYIKFLQPEAKTIIFWIAVLYSCIAIPLIIVKVKNNKNSHGFILLKFIFNWVIYSKNLLLKKEYHSQIEYPSLNNEDKNRLLFILVKFIFIPIMIKYSVANYFLLEKRYLMMIQSTKPFLQLINENFFLVAVSVLLLTDTLLYAFGYLVESSFFKNKIKSVDPTAFGWLVALACYPPLNKITGTLFPLDTNYKIFFWNETTTLIFRGIIILLLLIFTLSSVSLGFKCSNLTNRGIVKKGTYALVRHPAYISKILIWWVLLLPSIPSRPEGLIIIVFWTILYYFRAITEEKHLSADPDYIAYCKKVKYRFLPGII